MQQLASNSQRFWTPSIPINPACRSSLGLRSRSSRRPTTSSLRCTWTQTTSIATTHGSGKTKAPSSFASDGTAVRLTTTPGAGLRKSTTRNTCPAIRGAPRAQYRPRGYDRFDVIFRHSVIHAVSSRRWLTMLFRTHPHCDVPLTAPVMISTC